MLKIYTDGSCIKNPGGRGGYGAVLLTEPPILIRGHIPETTSNRAELTALIVSIFHAQSLNYKDLVVYTDSRYVEGIVKGIMNRSANLDLWDLLDLATSTLNSFKILWVKAHDGNPNNELADKLAREGSDLYLAKYIEENNEELTPTEVGLLLRPKMKPIDLNKFLLKHGYQYKPYKDYKLTDKGKKFAVVEDFIDFSGSGYSKFKWKPTIVNEVQNLLDQI
jgi:ribonuclease HI